MEKVVFVSGGNLQKLNEDLNQGWTVKDCKPVSEYIGGVERGSNNVHIYAYFVLTKEK